MGRRVFDIYSTKINKKMEEIWLQKMKAPTL